MSTKSKLKKGTAICDSCIDVVKDFVAVLKNDHARTNNKHWIICMNCYHRDGFWQERIARKVMALHPKKPKKSIPSSTNNVSKEVWEASVSKKEEWDTDW